MPLQNCMHLSYYFRYACKTISGTFILCGLVLMNLKHQLKIFFFGSKKPRTDDVDQVTFKNFLSSLKYCSQILQPIC